MNAELRDALQFLYADSKVARKPVRRTTIDVARGGTGAVHVLLNDLTEGKRITLSVTEKGRAVKLASWFRLIDVPVEVNTGPVSFIEKKGERNRFVTRRAPFRVTDAMEPIRSSLKATSSTMSLRLHIPSTRPGRRQFLIDISSSGKSNQLSVNVVTHKATIPAVGAGSFPYTNWFSYSVIAKRHGLTPWSAAHWRMIRRYADLMVHGRQNAFWIPLGDIFTKTGRTLTLDRQRLRRIVKTFTDAGMHIIEGGHLAGRKGGEWQATTYDLSLTKAPATSTRGNADMASIAHQLMDEIKRNGWHDRWIQHVADEPAPWNGADYRIMVGMVHKYMPGIPIMDATEDPGLVGSVDIWCPKVEEYQKHRKHFDIQREVGDKIWFYTCCFPGGPWLNRLLDMELLRPCLFGWGAALYDLHGYLHWGLNHYKSFQDPFEQSVVKHGSSTYLPAGDTHIVYPGKGAPWSSLRLEAQREGFEDLELFLQLKERDPAAADRIVRKAITRFDRYTKDPAVLRSARRELLRALS